MNQLITKYWWYRLLRVFWIILTVALALVCVWLFLRWSIEPVIGFHFDISLIAAAGIVFVIGQGIMFLIYKIILYVVIGPKKPQNK